MSASNKIISKLPGMSTDKSTSLLSKANALGAAIRINHFPTCKHCGGQMFKNYDGPECLQCGRRKGK